MELVQSRGFLQGFLSLLQIQRRGWQPICRLVACIVLFITITPPNKAWNLFLSAQLHFAITALYAFRVGYCAYCSECYAVMIANAFYFLYFYNHLQILEQLRRNVSYVKFSTLTPSHCWLKYLLVCHGPIWGHESTLHYDTYCHQGPSAIYVHIYLLFTAGASSSVRSI